LELPEGVGEADLLEALEKVARAVSRKYLFGYYEIEDIRQQAKLFALEALPKYDATYGNLAGFLWTHARNRLLNLQRDKLRRVEPPCCRCACGDYCRDGGLPCSRHQEWESRNAAKSSLMRPAKLAEERATEAPDVGSALDQEDLRRKVDEVMPVALRESYLKLLAGLRVGKSKRRAVEQVIREALGCSEKKGARARTR
jgi:DNA-directed RNA polymerase specialized sigma24 family protein